LTHVLFAMIDLILRFQDGSAGGERFSRSARRAVFLSRTNPRRRGNDKGKTCGVFRGAFVYPFG